MTNSCSMCEHGIPVNQKYMLAAMRVENRMYHGHSNSHIRKIVRENLKLKEKFGILDNPFEPVTITLSPQAMKAIASFL